jgi:hypothetical protein
MKSTTFSEIPSLKMEIGMPARNRSQMAIITNLEKNQNIGVSQKF